MKINHYKKAIFLCAAAASCCTGVATSAGTIVLIDVGRSSTVTSDSGWNNLNNGADSGSFGSDFGVTDMVDSTGSATAIDVTVDSSGGGSWAGSGADYSTAPSPFASAPTTAVQDSMFIRGTSVDIIFSDLTAGYTYDFVIWGARGNNGTIIDNDVIFTIADGNGSSVGTYADSFENSDIVEFTGLVADINGEITMTFETITPSGSANNGTTTESGALNVIQITENVPEPGSLALLGFGGFFVFRRRR